MFRRQPSTRRLVYLLLFAILGGTAAVLTLKAQHTVNVVVATHDLRAGAKVVGGDLEVRALHADALPAGTLATADAAAGRYVAWPLTAGEPVLDRSLTSQPSGSTLVSGLSVPSGYRAIAVPVQPAAAVGGVLHPGDRVDVFATPQQGRGTTPAAPDVVGASPASTATTQLGHDVLVVQLRTDQGASMEQQADAGVHGLNFGNGKLGSVVLAVPVDDVQRYAGAAAVDTIYLALSVS